MDITNIIELHQQWLKNNETGKRADFSGQTLYGLNFTNTNLKSGWFVNSVFIDCVFNYSNFMGAEFKGAKFTNTKISNSHFQYSDFIKADLTGCAFENVNLCSVGFDESVLTRAKFNKCDFDLTRFIGASLDNATFNDSNIIDSVFDGASLNKTRFVLVNLKGSTFKGTNIAVANFSKTDTSGADFDGAISTVQPLDIADSNSLHETMMGWVVMTPKHPQTGTPCVMWNTFRVTRRASIADFISRTNHSWIYWKKHFGFRCVKAQSEIRISADFDNMKLMGYE